jgi:hypothetical protein
MAYCDNLPIFDYSGTQLVDSFTLASIPTVYRGFLTLVAALLIHFVLLGVTVNFTKGVHSTRLDNVWHTIAQLNSEETRGILNQATLASDRDVRKWLNREMVTHRVRLGRSSNNTRGRSLDDNRVQILKA